MREYRDSYCGGAGEDEIDQGSRYEQYVVGVSEMLLHWTKSPLALPNDFRT